MQIKKNEVREQILKAAREEFLQHGYEGSSLRQVAKRANTTLGNIYHYFPKKEALLSELLVEPIRGLNRLIEIHLEQKIQIHSLDEVERALKVLDDKMDCREFAYLMDERLLILFDLKTTHFVEDREHFMEKFKEHIAWHLNIGHKESPYINIIADMFISCIRHVLLARKNAEGSKKEFLKIFRMLCTGLVVNKEEE